MNKRTELMKFVNNAIKVIIDKDASKPMWELKILEVDEEQPNHNITTSKPSVYIYYAKKDEEFTLRNNIEKAKKTCVTYIGETMDQNKRAAQHSDKKGKNILVFESSCFHKSAIYDIETQLISLALASNQGRKLSNLKNNQTNYNYYTKGLYKNVPKQIWCKLTEILEKEGVVLEEYDKLIESQIYKFSPYKVTTTEQQLVIDELIDMAIDKSGDNFKKTRLVEGKPGTGKSVVLAKVVCMLYDGMTMPESEKTDNWKNLKFKKIIVSAGNTEIRDTYEKMFKNIGMPEESVSVMTEVGILRAISKGKYKDSIVLIDEAHNFAVKNINKFKGSNSDGMAVAFNYLKPNQSTIIEVSKHFSKSIFFSDPSQRLERTSVNTWMKEFDKKKTSLKRQMRSSAGWIEFIDFALLNKELDKEKVYNTFTIDFLGEEIHVEGENSEDEFKVKIYNKMKLMVEDLGIIKDKDDNKSIAMLSSYSYKHLSAKDPNKFDFNFDGFKAKWKLKQGEKEYMQFTEWLSTPKAYNFKEVAYHLTVQGFEMEHVGLIMGNDLNIVPIKSSTHEECNTENTIDYEILINEDQVYGGKPRKAFFMNGKIVNIKDIEEKSRKTSPGFGDWKTYRGNLPDTIEKLPDTIEKGTDLNKTHNEYWYKEYLKDAGEAQDEYDKELRELVLNRYRVLLTRATESINIFIEDEKIINFLKHKLKKYNEKIRELKEQS